ncbi:MAG: Lrp/AsnC ligand binding domain-containing protein, partial [Dehalococcoidia bacterium]|nr:Lrp/AsnC ligand binding domain-containing protein [Dehalococcoidia bacterium]
AGMEKAYVLIETQVGKTKDVVEAIRGVEGVISVDAVTGPYDAIAVVQGETLNEIGDLITAKVHPISGISRTVTCLVLKSS